MAEEQDIMPPPTPQAAIPSTEEPPAGTPAAPPAPEEEPPGGPQQPPASKSLYDQLNKGRLYTNSYDEFQKRYNTPKAVDELYDNLNKAQLYTNSKDEFYDKYFTDLKAAKAQAPERVTMDEVRQLNAQAEKPVPVIETPMRSYQDPGAAAENKAQQDQLIAKTDFLGKQWGVPADAAKRAVIDFPETGDEKEIKERAQLLVNNPVAYGRLKDAYDIQHAIAFRGKDVDNVPRGAISENSNTYGTGNQWKDQETGMTGVELSTLFNHLQTSDNYQELQKNINLQQQIIDKAGLGEKYQQKLRDTQSPLINPLDEGMNQQYWQSGDHELGLSPFQYAGLETERLFNKDKYNQDVELIQNHSAPVPADQQAHIDEVKGSYEYRRGMENTLYNLELQGRKNTEQYINERTAELKGPLQALQQQYQDRITQATTPEEQQRLIAEFANHPLVEESKRMDDGQQQLSYAKSEDKWKFPLNANDQATRLVKDAMDNTTGFFGNVKKWGENLALGTWETLDNTKRFVGNTAINIAGSDQSKAFSIAKDIGHKSLTDLATYEPTSYTGTESPFAIPEKMINDVQSIFTDPGLSDIQKHQKANEYIKNNFDQIQLNPKAGQQNITGKSVLFQSANVVGQIVGIAGMSYLLGGAGVAGEAGANASKIKDLATAFAPMYVSTQNQLYERALANGEKNPILRSSIDASIISLASLINPDIKVLKGMVGADTGLGKMIAGIDEGTWNKVLSENPGLVQRMSGFVKATGKQLGLANLQYGLIVPTAQYLAHKNILNEDPNLGDMLKDGIVQANLTMALPALVHGVWGGIKATDVNPQQKFALFEAGLNPERHIEAIDAQVQAGQLTPDMGKRMKSTIEKATEILHTVDPIKSDGTPMNEREGADLLYNMLRKGMLEERAKTAPAPQQEAIKFNLQQVDNDIEQLHATPEGSAKMEAMNVLTDNADKFPEIYQEMAKRDPEGMLKFIADQAQVHTTDAAGEEIDPRPRVDKDFGKDVVDKAIELFPQTKTETDGTQTDKASTEAGARQQTESRVLKPGEEAAGQPAASLQLDEGRVPPFTTVSGTEVMEHAEDTATASELENGTKPTELSEKGKQEAANMGEYLKDKGKKEIVSSPVERAQRTAETAAEVAGIDKLSTNDNLKTWNIGKYDGQPEGSFDEKYYAQHPNEVPEGGESFTDFTKRMEAGYKDVDGYAPEVQAIAHSKVIRAFRALKETDGEWTLETTKRFLANKEQEPPGEQKATITNQDFKNLADEKGFTDLKEVAPRLAKDFNDGDKVEFFADKKRVGIWDKKRGLIVDDKGLPWGLTGILNNKEGYVKNLTQTEPMASKEGAPGQTEVSGEAQPNAAAAALQGSYDRLIKGGADPDEPEMKQLEKRISELNKTTQNAETVRSDTGPGDSGRDVPASSQDEGSKNIQLDAQKEAGAAPAEQQAGREQSGPSGTKRPETKTADAVKPEEDDLPFIYEKGDDSITGIRNQITEEKIEEAGLTPALKVIKRTFATVWDEALKKVKKGYDPQHLVDQLKKKARPLTDLEDALLLIHQVGKEANLDAANREILAASEKGDAAALEEAKLRRVKAKDDLQDIYDVDKAVGTANARGLAARKMIADRKYSLINMEMDAKAAQDGKPLSEEQSAEIEKRFNDIKEKKDALDKRVAELEAENKALRARETLRKATSKGGRPKKTAAEYSAKRKDILQKMKDDLLKAAKGGEGLTASIPFAAQLKAIAPHIPDLLKTYIDQGIDTLEGVTHEMKMFLSPLVPGITESHIHDLIAGEFKEVIPPAEQKSKAALLREEARQMKFAITDSKTMKLRANYERTKTSWDDTLREIELSKRTKAAKIQDTFVKWERAFKLSGITTLAKLGMAAATRLSTSPVENLVGAAYSAMLPKIAGKATIEGGISLKAEARAITQAFTQGMKDSYDTMSKESRGQSDIEAIFNKKGQLPPEAIGFFGQLHSAIKAPVKRAAFERALYKQIQANLKAGVDVSDPMVQATIALRAYKEGQRSIFMQDNVISEGYKIFINSLEKSKKFPTQGKAIATAAQWLIPFVKVPTNIVGETATHVAGVPIAAAKILHTVFTKGLDNLSDDESDMILRNLKKGTIGAGALALGYCNPKAFGGYYQPGEKRKEGDLKPGQSMIFGQRIPAWLLESPIFQAMQIGATVRRVSDTVVKGKPNGITAGVLAGGLGLALREPLADEPGRIYSALKDAKERQYFLGELAKSTVEPMLLQNIAEFMDKAKDRKPETLKEHMEMGVPGLREKVPEKKPAKGTRPSRGKRR